MDLPQFRTFTNKKALTTYKNMVSAISAMGLDFLNDSIATGQLELRDAVFTTEVGDKFFRIVVKDCLPRCRVDLTTKLYWTKIMAMALQDCRLSFEKILLIVDIHAGGAWDPDNRAIKTLIDGIRYAQLIPDDNAQYLSYMVTGEAKSDDPKTIITLIQDSPNDNIISLLYNRHL